MAINETDLGGCLGALIGVAIGIVVAFSCGFRLLGTVLAVAVGLLLCLYAGAGLGTLWSNWMIQRRRKRH